MIDEIKRLVSSLGLGRLGLNSEIKMGRSNVSKITALAIYFGLFLTAMFIFSDIGDEAKIELAKLMLLGLGGITTATLIYAHFNPHDGVETINQLRTFELTSKEGGKLDTTSQPIQKPDELVIEYAKEENQS